MKRSRTSRRLRSPNGPPPDEPWGWFTREMIESEAWRAMPLAARRIVERVLVEHMNHGGTSNGVLTVTYDDFIKFGLSSRRGTAVAIRIACGLGFVDVTERGRRSYGGARRASRYGLTWLPTFDRRPASNRWRAIDTLAAAEATIKQAREKLPIHNIRILATRRATG